MVTLVSILLTLPLLAAVARSPRLRRPGWVVWVAAAAAAPCLLVAGTINWAAKEQLGLPPSVGRAVLHAMLIVGPVEEGAKFVVVLGLSWWFRLRERPLAFVACGLGVGLGIAALETPLHVASWRLVPSHTVLRSIHALLTGLASTVWVLARHSRRPTLYRTGGLLAAAALHGAWDSPLFIAKQTEVELVSPAAWALLASIPTAGLFAFSLVRLESRVRSHGEATSRPAATRIAARLGLLVYAFMLAALLANMVANLGATTMYALIQLGDWELGQSHRYTITLDGPLLPGVWDFRLLRWQFLGLVFVALLLPFLLGRFLYGTWRDLSRSA